MKKNDLIFNRETVRIGVSVRFELLRLRRIKRVTKNYIWVHGTKGKIKKEEILPYDSLSRTLARRIYRRYLKEVENQS